VVSAGSLAHHVSCTAAILATFRPTIHLPRCADFPSHFSLYAKKLDRGRFIWPQTVGGVVALTAGQMSYLLEAIDWRNPQQTWRPQSAG
jgi:transposase